MKSRIAMALILTLATAAASAQRTARHVEDLARGGLLVAPTGEPPEMVSVAGSRYLDLVPDSKQEVCYRLLAHQARITKGLYRLRVVTSEGREIWKCSL